jgi:hypothetical protein
MKSREPEKHKRQSGDSEKLKLLAGQLSVQLISDGCPEFRRKNRQPEEP